MRTLRILLLSVLSAAALLSDALALPPAATQHGMATIARNPYIGSVAVDAASGRVLLEENADAVVYPASCVKLMSLLITLDGVSQQRIRLADAVQITAESARIGGSQVFLKEHEAFTVEELIYALTVKSANDAAAALAIHVAGSQPAFVALMNRKAQELGLTRTRFFSCHGLPPTPPRTPDQVDVSTPRDLAVLARALVLEHPEALRYTATVKRTFRNGTFEMVNHDKLLGNVPGVDGLKTGWFPAAGYSIVASARRDGRRVIVVIAGSVDRLVRDAAATEQLARGFATLPPPPRDVPPTNIVTTAAVPTAAAVATGDECAPGANRRAMGVVAGVIVAGALVVAGVLIWRRRMRGASTSADAAPRHRPLPPLRR